MYTTSSLLLYVPLIALMFTMAYQVYQASKVGRQAALLRRFRTLGDTVSIFLLDNLDSEELTNNDKIELRNIIHQLDLVTDYFDKAKSKFTYSRVAGVLFAPDSIKQSVAEGVSDNPAMIPIRAEIARALFYAFTQHIPLLRFRVIMYMFKPFCLFVLEKSKSHLAGQSWLKQTKRVMDEFQQVEKQRDYYVHLCHVQK